MFLLEHKIRSDCYLIYICLNNFVYIFLRLVSSNIDFMNNENFSIKICESVTEYRISDRKLVIVNFCFTNTIFQKNSVLK